MVVSAAVGIVSITINAVTVVKKGWLVHYVELCIEVGNLEISPF